MNAPAIFSVDDHVVEPPHTWQSRLPAKYKELGPKIVRAKVDVTDTSIPNNLREFFVSDDAGTECWSYEDNLLVPSSGLAAAAGRSFEEFSKTPLTFAEMRPGCYDPVERLSDMDQDGCLASVCFPTFSRFCGQTFAEGKDKTLSLLCVQAYNDFVLEEWCGAAPGRFVPLVIIPLWDAKLAAKEIERVAALGARAITFNELPHKLGHPSIHDPNHYWDPMFDAASNADMPLCIHIGSSSEIYQSSDDAPAAISIAGGPINAQTSLLDWLFSGVVVRHPNLKIVLSEGGIGWIPYLLERADYTFEHQAWSDLPISQPPSTYFQTNFYGCFIDDQHGLKSLDEIGVDNVMMEVDYPHSDSTFPHSGEIAAKSLAGLTPEVQHKLLRGNAERVFRFEPSAIGQK